MPCVKTTGTFTAFASRGPGYFAQSTPSVEKVMMHRSANATATVPTQAPLTMPQRHKHEDRFQQPQQPVAEES